MAQNPALQAEDDGFFMQLRDEILAPHLLTLNLEECETLRECLDKVMRDSEYATDKGVSLPLYLPEFGKDGVACAYDAKPVWSGEHIDIPLYGNLKPREVELLITGGKRVADKLDKKFLSYSPAFRVALLVHHICQVIIINPMAAEAYVLGRYEDLGLDDAHYKERGIPSTEYMQLNYSCGLNTEWAATSPTSYMGKHRQEPRVSGWTMRVRGAHPKRDDFYDAWHELINRLDGPIKTINTIDGKKLQSFRAGAPKKRKRAGDSDVELMCKFVDNLIENEKFPVRGNLKDWKAAKLLLAKRYPYLANRWSPDAMRRSYKNHQGLTN